MAKLCSIYFEDAHKDAIDRIAKATGKSRNQVVNNLLLESPTLQKELKKPI